MPTTSLYILYENLPEQFDMVPTSYCTNPIYRERHNENHVQMRLHYYKGFEKKYLTENTSVLNETVIERFKSRLHRGDYNDISDTLQICKTDLTDDILSKFRYIQPKFSYDAKIVHIDPYILGL
jgi:hypothetical protein